MNPFFWFWWVKTWWANRETASQRTIRRITEIYSDKRMLNVAYGKYAQDYHSAYPAMLAKEWTIGGVTNVRLSDSKTVHISELVPLKCVIADEITGKVMELEQDEMRNLRSALESLGHEL